MPLAPAKSRWILNIALAVAVLGLVALVYFRPAINKAADPPLTALTPDAVMQIRIERSGQTITLEKANNTWRVTSPMRVRANSFNVDSVLRVTTVASSFHTAADTTVLASYGLDKPALRLRLNDEAIDIGAMHPMHQQHYVRYRDTVHLIPSYVLTTILQPYTVFIDAQLLEPGRKLKTLRLPAFQLKQKNATWRREPADKKFDESISTDRLNGFVAEWENARALSVEKLTSKPVLAQVQLDFEENGKAGTLKLDILAYKPEFVLARRDEGLEYHFPEDIGKRLLTLTTE